MRLDILAIRVRMHESQIREVLRATMVHWHDMVRMENLSILQVLVATRGWQTRRALQSMDN
jgi:hypothetical protein